MVADQLAVEIDVGGIVNGGETQKDALADAGWRVELTLIPHQAVIVAQGRIVADPGARDGGHGSAAQIVLEERAGGISLHGLLDINVGAASLGGILGVAVEVGQAVAVGIDRPVPWAGQTDAVAQVAINQDVLWHDLGVVGILRRSGRAGESGLAGEKAQADGQDCQGCWGAHYIPPQYLFVNGSARGGP